MNGKSHAFDVAGQIKERLTAREVIEFYGFHIDRAGYIQCPFHMGDDHGSLKVYERDKTGWHCFGCGAGGSVIDFVMRLFGINFRQAVLRLNTDFNLGLTGENRTTAGRSAILEQRRREAERKLALEAEYRRLAEEYRNFWEIIKCFPPELTERGEMWVHPSYAGAVQGLPGLEYRLDEIVRSIGR